MDTERLPLIVAFTDAIAERHNDRVLLMGGKAANLIEMRQTLGLPVPTGFVLTTHACHRYLNGGWNDEFEAAVITALRGIESEVGRQFGGLERPLLVSVRSGAPRSMPGMLDTVLNVGINESIAAALGAEVGDRAFAEETWLRFTRMFAETVLSLAPSAVAEAAAVDDRRKAIEAVRRLADDAGGIPDDPYEQLRQSIQAVFRSWTGDRAAAFREREGIAASMGTACTVQAMVFGNLNDRSGTGVVFTRDPSTGEQGLYGNYLAVAQGEDLVSGTVNAAPIATLATANPELFEELRGFADRLERHYRDMCDIEFTISDGTLYLLQTRVARRSPRAAVVAAVDMADDPTFPLSRAEAVERVSLQQIESLQRARSVRDEAVAVTSGIGASPGAVCGVAESDLDAAIDRTNRGQDVILVRNETSPADVRAMMGAVGIITCVGGVASHAAVVARGWGIPAVVGCDTVSIGAEAIEVGDTTIDLGTLITLDGDSGNIYLGDQTETAAATDTALGRLEQWRAELGLASPASPSGPPDNPENGPEDPEIHLGGPGESVDVDESAAARSTPLAITRVVQFKGMASIEGIATSLDIPARVAQEVVASLPDGLVTHSAMGVMLTPAGRSWLDDALGAERSDTIAADLASSYETFMAINTAFKQTITTWQISDQNDAAFDELVAELDAVHAAVMPIVDHATAHVPRLGHFGPRLTRAREQVHGGDRTMIASPLADSYHTVWFEFHEELIHLCGRNRLDEERRETNEQLS